MIKKIKKNNDIMKIAKSLLKTPLDDSLCNVVFSEGLQKLLLYPTYDVYLNEEQFTALKSFLENIDEDEFYAVNHYVVSDDPAVLPADDFFYLASRDISYEQYTDIFVYHLSVMFSKNGKWAIVIEESLEDGIGIMAAQPKMLELFKDCHPKYKQELENFIRFSELEQTGKNVKLDYCERIMALLKN